MKWIKCSDRMPDVLPEDETIERFIVEDRVDDNYRRISYMSYHDLKALAYYQKTLRWLEESPSAAPEQGEWQLCPKCNGGGMAMNMMNEIPSVLDLCDVCNGKKIIERPASTPSQTDDGWVSVEDGLPEEGVSVLIYEPSGDTINFPEHYQMNVTRYFRKNKKKGIFYNWEDGQDEQPGGYYPTHWRPLPEPPK